MKKKDKQGLMAFDEAFDKGETTIDFRNGVVTQGLSKVIKLPPLTIPAWLALEIEQLSKTQANSKSAVIRQLLVEAVEARRHRAA